MLRRRLFVVSQIMLYLMFLSIDIFGEKVTVSGQIKYSIVILCLIYAFWSKVGHVAERNYIRAGLFFTATSDWMLLFMDRQFYFYGVLSFIIAQQSYGLLLKRLNSYDKGIYQPNTGLYHKRAGVYPRRESLWSWLLRIGIQSVASMVIYAVLHFLHLPIDRLLAVTIFYFISLLYNVIYGLKMVASDPGNQKKLIFTAGIFLFLLCDINVGLFNLSDYLPLSETFSEQLYQWSSVLMWAFYAPSQVLIALSSDTLAKTTKKDNKFVESVK